MAVEVSKGLRRLLVKGGRRLRHCPSLNLHIPSCQYIDFLILFSSFICLSFIFMLVVKQKEPLFGLQKCLLYSIINLHLFVTDNFISSKDFYSYLSDDLGIHWVASGVIIALVTYRPFLFGGMNFILQNLSLCTCEGRRFRCICGRHIFGMALFFP